MANVIFKIGTKAQYDGLAVKDANTLYWLTDVLELRKGESLYGKGTGATNLASGLMSAADKEKLDALSGGTALSLTPVDNTIVIADAESGKSIGVKVSAEAGNALTVKEDGLFVPTSSAFGNVEFALEAKETPTDGYSATYKLKRTEGENVTYVGDEINIPADKVLQSGTLAVVTEADQPYEGAMVDDPYLDLVLNDAPGKGISIDNETVSVKLDNSKANGLIVGVAGLGLSEATVEASGAMSASDKEALDAAVNDIADIKASIVWGTMESKEPTV